MRSGGHADAQSDDATAPYITSAHEPAPVRRACAARMEPRWRPVFFDCSMHKRLGGGGTTPISQGARRLGARGGATSPGRKTVGCFNPCVPCCPKDKHKNSKSKSKQSYSKSKSRSCHCQFRQGDGG